MKRIFTLIALAFLALSINAQEADSLVEEISSEYYYCFAMFQDSVFYSNVLEFEYDTVSKFEYIDAKWQTYVKEDLGLKHFMPIVVGPYIEKDDIKLDIDNWKNSFPDSVMVKKVKYQLVK